MSTSGSSSARSTATSVVGSVSESSAFRYRVVADLEVGDPLAPLEVRAAEVGDAGRAEVVEPLERLRPSAAASPRRGASRSAREASTYAKKSPWAISSPSLSGSARSRSAATCSRVGTSPGEALGRGVDEVLVANREPEVVRQREVDVLGVVAQEADALGVERRFQPRVAASASASDRPGRAGRRASSRSPRVRYSDDSRAAAAKLADRRPGATPPRRRSRPAKGPLPRASLHSL